MVGSDRAGGKCGRPAAVSVCAGNDALKTHGSICFKPLPTAEAIKALRLVGQNSEPLADGLGHIGATVECGPQVMLAHHQILIDFMRPTASTAGRVRAFSGCKVEAGCFGVAGRPCTGEQRAEDAGRAICELPLGRCVTPRRALP